MGTRAVVECPECGEGRLEASAVTVRARLETDQWSYRFTCPSCSGRAVANTSRTAALLAIEAGAPLETWFWLGETEDRGVGDPPLTLVDLLDLRGSMAEPDWLDGMTREGDAQEDRS